MKYGFILDGSNLIIRRFYSRDKMYPKDGLRDIINYIKEDPNRYFKDYNPEKDTFKIVMTIDYSEAKKTRQAIYSEYKNQEARHIRVNDERFISETRELKQLDEFEGVTVLKSVDIEADDIIANLCVNNKDTKIIIVSNDKDFFSLLSDNVSVFRNVPGGYSNGLYTIYNLMSDYKGIVKNNLNLFPILRAFLGDASDNIKGVCKIGEKTGLKYVNTLFKLTSLEDAYRKMLFIMSKTGRSREDIETYKLAYKLISPIYVNDINWSAYFD